MAKTTDIANFVKNGGKILPQKALTALINSNTIKQRFKELLGEKSSGFLSSLLSVVNNNKLLQAAEPMSVISAAALAASVDLPINPSLNVAFIVPYRDNKSGTVKAQFQMGWKGFYQLALRTGQYKTINVAELYDGEMTDFNRITGEISFGQKKSDELVGFVAYFRLLTGFEKYLYMTKSEMEKHGRRYSKSYDSGLWTSDFVSMGKKTVIKQLLSKYGLLSVEMQKAIEVDQAIIKEDGSPEYIDNADEENVVEKTETAQEHIPFGETADDENNKENI